MQLSPRSELVSRTLKSLALACLLVMPIVMGASPGIFGDGDVSWHIAAGNWILTHGRVPATDPFSYTMLGQPWVAFEWLSEIIYASAFNLAGYRGLSVVVMLAMLGLHVVTFSYLVRKASPLALVVAFVALDFILVKFLYARPHVLAWPVLALWTATLLKCRDEGQPPPIILALLMVLWVNLHASFLLGFVIAGAIALDAVIEARWNRTVIWNWGKFGLIIVAAAFINANGLIGVIHPFNVMRLENLSLINEWKPSFPAMTPAFYAVLLAALGLCLWKGIKLRPGEIALLLFLLFMAFSQVRHQSWLSVVAVMILTPRLSDQDNRERPAFWTAEMRPLTITLACVAALMLAGRMIWPIKVKDDAANPRALLAHVPADLRAKPVFNGYSFGGPLILAGIRPYIDGRSEMYGDKFVSDYFRMKDGDIQRFNVVAKEYCIAWSLLTPDSKLGRALDASSDWRRLYADDSGVIRVPVSPSKQLNCQPQKR